MSIFRPSEVIVGASDMGAMRRPHVDYICDGTADNVQIQAAIDALPSSGGTVVLSEGTFNIAATVTWTTSNVRIVGQGRSTVLTQVANVQIFSTSGVAATTEHALASNAALGNTTAVLGAGDGSNYAADDWIVVLSTGVWTSTTSKILYVGAGAQSLTGNYTNPTAPFAITMTLPRVNVDPPVWEMVPTLSCAMKMMRSSPATMPEGSTGVKLVLLVVVHRTRRT